GTMMVVRVLLSSYMPVMLVMLRQEPRVPIVSKEKSGNGTDKAIQFRSTGSDYAVHGVVGGNKKPGIQVHLQQQKQVWQWRGEINRKAQQVYEQAKPARHDNGCDCYTSVISFDCLRHGFLTKANLTKDGINYQYYVVVYP